MPYYVQYNYATRKTEVPSARKSEQSITKRPPTLILAYISSCNAFVEQRQDLVDANKFFKFPSSQG